MSCYYDDQLIRNALLDKQSCLTGEEFDWFIKDMPFGVLRYLSRLDIYNSPVEKYILKLIVAASQKKPLNDHSRVMQYLTKK